MKENNDDFITCGKCGRRLIKRKEDGSFYFRFGSKKQLSDEEINDIFSSNGFVIASKGRAAIEFFAKGCLQMRCLSPTCDHVTTII